eukprot:TRINITY_DN27279_c0_g1_i1.p1 TRINITY_DN27279_c0_g1~~TRINITY_DN27279_c0_g1_i1.p1  ORF type:complete len:144 (-),score=10.69 TRINITY_DN27279_c0_g1_i1:97-528(-)
MHPLVSGKTGINAMTAPSGAKVCVATNRVFGPIPRAGSEGPNCCPGAASAAAARAAILRRRRLRSAAVLLSSGCEDAAVSMRLVCRRCERWHSQHRHCVMMVSFSWQSRRSSGNWWLGSLQSSRSGSMIMARTRRVPVRMLRC